MVPMARVRPRRGAWMQSAMSVLKRRTRAPGCRYGRTAAGAADVGARQWRDAWMAGCGRRWWAVL
eukprot:333649-Chlamydomonas_euryale.AAC.2